MTQTDIKVMEPVIADGKMTEEQRKSFLRATRRYC